MHRKRRAIVQVDIDGARQNVIPSYSHVPIAIVQITSPQYADVAERQNLFKLN